MAAAVLCAFLPDVTRQQLPQIQALFARMGQVKSLTFNGPFAMGGDAYDVAFANGAMTMGVAIGPDGKIAGVGIMQGPPPGG